jgi:hypothetical protein
LITNLLPGLRDLRTPLAVGYLWLVALWLVLYKHLPKSIGTARGPMKSLYELGDFVGKGVVLAAATFVAYLLGSLLVRPPRTWLNAKADQKDDEAGKDDDKFDWVWIYLLDGHIADSAILQLRSFVDNKLREVEDVMHPWLHRRILEARELPIIQKDDDPYATILNLRSAYVSSILEDQDLVGMQLQARNRDLWETYDRKTAESHFRYGITWPLIAIIAIISLQSSWFWLFLLIIPVWLLTLAWRLNLEAKATLIQAIITGLVVPPILEDLDKGVKKRREELKQLKDQGPKDDSLGSPASP